MRLERARDKLVELLALDLGHLELKRGGLAAAVATGAGASTPGGATVHLGEVGGLGEVVGVTLGNVDDAVVREGAHRGEGGRCKAFGQSGTEMKPRRTYTLGPHPGHQCYENTDVNLMVMRVP